MTRNSLRLYTVLSDVSSCRTRDTKATHFSFPNLFWYTMWCKLLSLIPPVLNIWADFCFHWAAVPLYAASNTLTFSPDSVISGPEGLLTAEMIALVATLSRQRFQLQEERGLLSERFNTKTYYPVYRGGTVMENKITVDLYKDFGCLPQLQVKHGRIWSFYSDISFQGFEALLSLLPV